MSSHEVNFQVNLNSRKLSDSKFCSFKFLILLIGCFFNLKSTAEVISCDAIVNCLDFENCCFGNATAAIHSKSFKFAGNDETVYVIWFSSNGKIKYLPIQVSNSFPNLEIYNAENCTISEISKENFENLHNLQTLNLAGNQIEVVPDDAFEDLSILDRIDLGNLLSTTQKPVLTSLTCCRSQQSKINQLGVVFFFFVHKHRDFGVQSVHQ